LLISPELLVEDGLLTAEDLPEPTPPSDRVHFHIVEHAKPPLIHQAVGRFEAAASPALREELERFTLDHAWWLDDFALFMALHVSFNSRPWHEWPAAIRMRKPDALERARRDLAELVHRESVTQFLFWRQWQTVRRRANDAGIRVIGDIPIFVALDSADVWANPEMFWLDRQGRPQFVAGVPPDLFSETGQRWGNPLYRWDAIKANGYRWWIERFRATLEMVDVIRIDHFRGFQAYWEIPARHSTAEKGRWAPGPGHDLFRAAREALGELPILVEDLGEITPDVVELREELGYPGMKVLQFAFDSGPTNPYLPHNYDANFVVYTGTHDNDTTVSWFEQLPEKTRDHIRRYLGVDGLDIAWDLIRQALASVADLAIVPIQDVLALGGEGRMNHPGQSAGNWSWRLQPGQLVPEHAQRLGELASLYGRVVAEEEAESPTESESSSI